MIDLLQLQKRVYQNKIAKGFNVTDIFHGVLTKVKN